MKKIINKTRFNKISFNKTCFKKILNLILLVSTLSFSANAQKPAGLVNNGNYCYMNASVQCLANIPELRNVLIANKYHFAQDPILTNFTNLIEQLKIQQTTQNSEPLMQSQGVRFFPASQYYPRNPLRMQDSDEFLTKLLDEMPQGAQNIFSTEINIAPEHIPFCTKGYLTSLDKSPKILKLQNQFSFDEGINNFFVNEGIQKRITKLPKILILRLGRVKETLLGFQKDNKAIPFKLNLNLEQYLANPRLGPAQYDLIGIVCHRGASFYDGHYYSYVKDSQDNNWYRCDDTNVHQVDVREITRIAQAEIISPDNTPYILFYQLKEGLGQQDIAGPPEPRRVEEQFEAPAPDQFEEDELAKVLRISQETARAEETKRKPQEEAEVAQIKAQEEKGKQEEADRLRAEQEKLFAKIKQEEADRKQQEETERLAQLEQERVRRERGAQQEQQRRLAEQRRQAQEQEEAARIELEQQRRIEQVQRQEEEQRRLAEQRRQEEQQQLAEQERIAERERLARIAAQPQPEVQAQPVEAAVKKEVVKINDPVIKSRLKQLNNLFNKYPNDPTTQNIFNIIKSLLLKKHNIELKQELNKQTMDYLNSILN